MKLRFVLLALSSLQPLFGVPAVPTPSMEAMHSLATAAEKELRQNILPFWIQHVPDRERGGFYGEIGEDLVVKKDAPRGALMTCRILWTYSAAYRVFHDESYRAMAQLAYDELLKNFWDKEQGGLYWTITSKGHPLDARKQIYLQAFGIYALSEYARATGDSAAKERAIALYRLVESRAYDSVNGGYFEAYSRDWKRLTANESSVMGQQAPKSQNTHLHVMEAFTALLRIWPEPELKQRQHQLIELMLTRIFDPVHHHLYLFQDETWKPLSEEISYGHDIEASWLLPEAAGVLGDSELMAKCNRASVEIARTILKEGVDTDGAIINTGGPHGYLDTRKDWWPQAEAVVGFLNAYELSHETPFLDAAQKTWRFIDLRFVDHVHGEWFETLTREGKPLPRPKVSLWKCPYHNGRLCLEVMERADALVLGK